MIVIINFWKGIFGYIVYNVIYGLDVGYVFMQVINNKNFKDEIYISYNFKIKNFIVFLFNFCKYFFLEFIVVDSFIFREKYIFFEKDCDNWDSKFNNKIVIYGLNEFLIIKFF